MNNIWLLTADMYMYIFSGKKYISTDKSRNDPFPVAVN